MMGKERKNRGVSEVVGTLILVGVVMIGIAIVALFLFANPAPSKIPVLNVIISNKSNTVYLLHKGGDSLWRGQYQIIVNGNDATASFSILSPDTEPWSVGKTLVGTLPYMPLHVALIFNQSGGTGYAASVLMQTDFAPVINVPAPAPNPPSMAWSNIPVFGNITTPFQFNDSSTSPDITSYFWDFHDGTTSTLQNPSHVFPCSSNIDYCEYDIDHSATDSGGTLWAMTSWLNRTSWVTVFKNLTPTVTFTQDLTSGTIPFTVTFTATPVDNITVDSWSWNFGDGTLTPNPHPYATAGVYSVSLVGTNYTLGVSPPFTKTSLIIATNVLPTVLWTVTPAFGNITTLFTFNDTSTGTNLTANSYWWGLNDTLTTTTTRNTTTTYPCTSEYCYFNINHTVTDSPGAPWAVVSALNQSNYLRVFKNLTPTVNFTQNKVMGIIPFTVTFTPNQIGAILVNSWSWDFGDGSSTPNPHTYNTAGTYTVKLNGTNFTLGRSPDFANISKACADTSPSWYNDNWHYRKEIDLDKNKVSGGSSLINFPVLINNTFDSDLKNSARPDGYDILFTDSSGTKKLPHEIEYYQQGVLTAWVNVSSLSPSSNTVIYMYYNNSGASDQEDVANVWTNNYQSVWHLKETTGGSQSIRDSTSTGNHGTTQNTPTLGAAGKIGNGISFDGSNEYISTTTQFSSPQTFTVSLWFKTSAATPRKLFGWETAQTGTGSADWDRHLWIGNSGGWLLGGIWNVSTNKAIFSRTTSNLADGNWHYAVLTFGSYTETLYVDNNNGITNATTGLAEVGTGSGYWRMGSYKINSWPYTPGDGYYTGTLDEVRVSSVVRSSDWIKTEYNNQNSPASFIKNYNAQVSWMC